MLHETERALKRQYHNLDDHLSSPPIIKRPRTSVFQQKLPLPEFWDNLHRIPLTRSALTELNRRNNIKTGVAKATRVRRSKRIKRQTLSSIPRKFQQYPYEDLVRFSRQGGPDLGDIRAYTLNMDVSKQPTSSKVSKRRTGLPRSKSSRDSGSATTATTKSTSPYDRAFDQHLRDHRIYPPKYSSTLPPPLNLKDITEVMERPRASLSPSRFTEDHFNDFQTNIAAACKEKQVSESVIPIIEGAGVCPRLRSGGVPFNNLDPLTDGTITPGNPDIFYGSPLEDLHKEARIHLMRQITPSTQLDLPALPNFTVAIKGPNGSASVAERQARYDGAIGSRAMHAIQSFTSQNDCPDGNAYTVSSTFHDGQLKIYTSHITRSGEGNAYVFTLIDAYAMEGSRRTFAKGASAYRNLRDWAAEQRSRAIEEANKSVEIRSQASKNSILDNEVIPQPEASLSEGQTKRATLQSSNSLAESEAPVLEELPQAINQKHQCTPPRRRGIHRKRQFVIHEDDGHQGSIEQ